MTVMVIANPKPDAFLSPRKTSGLSLPSPFVVAVCSRSEFLSHSLIFLVIISGNIFLNNDSKYAFKMWDVISDANNAPYGISRIDSSNMGTSNNPFPSFWTMLFTTPFVLNSNYAVQVGISVTVGNNGKLAVRTRDNGTWGDWNILS